MIQKIAIALVLATAGLTVSTAATADTEQQQIVGVSYRLATAIDVAEAITGQAAHVTAAEVVANAAAAPVWIRWESSVKRGAVQLMASFKGSHQFGRNDRSHASDGERLGFESRDVMRLNLPGLDGLLIKGLRVGARVNF